MSVRHGAVDCDMSGPYVMFLYYETELDEMWMWYLLCAAMSIHAFINDGGLIVLQGWRIEIRLPVRLSRTHAGR